MAPALSAEKPAPLHRTHWAVQLLAAAGLLGLVGFILIVVLFVAMGGPRDYQPAKVEGNDRKVTFTGGNPSDLPGTGLTRMDIAASAADGAYSSGRAQDTRNVLLIDRATGASRKLLPDNSRTIDQIYFLPATATPATDASDNPEMLVTGSDEKRTAVSPAYYLLVLRRAEPDTRDVLVGTLDGGR